MFLMSVLEADLHHTLLDILSTCRVSCNMFPKTF